MGGSVVHRIDIAVYPRWRGEHKVLLKLYPAETGLSPLARGTHHHLKPNLITRRFIPAGAGNSQLMIWPTSRSPVYPRWRGELSNANLLFKNTLFTPKHPTYVPHQFLSQIRIIKEQLTH